MLNILLKKNNFLFAKKLTNVKPTNFIVNVFKDREEPVN